MTKSWTSLYGKTTSIRHDPSYKQVEVKTNLTSFLCWNLSTILIFHFGLSFCSNVFQLPGSRHLILPFATHDKRVIPFNLYSTTCKRVLCAYSLHPYSTWGWISNKRIRYVIIGQFQFEHLLFCASLWFFSSIKRCTIRPHVEYRGRPLDVRRCHVIILKALLCIIVGGQIGIRSLYDKLSFVNLENE